MTLLHPLVVQEMEISRWELPDFFWKLTCHMIKTCRSWKVSAVTICLWGKILTEYGVQGPINDHFPLATTWAWHFGWSLLSQNILMYYFVSISKLTERWTISCTQTTIEDCNTTWPQWTWRDFSRCSVCQRIWTVPLWWLSSR